MNDITRTSKERLLQIAETIERRPVLGHWPHMRAATDAEFLRKLARETDLLREWHLADERFDLEDWSRRVRNLVEDAPQFFTDAEGTIDFQPASAHKLDKDDLLDELAPLLKQWERNRDRDYTPVHIRTAILRVIGEITGSAHEPPVRPAAWIRGVMSPGGPDGPPEYDEETVPGEDRPEGNGWVPLYYTRPSQPPGLLRDNERHAIWNVLQFCKNNPSMATGIDWTARKLLQELYDRSGSTKESAL